MERIIRLNKMRSILSTVILLCLGGCAVTASQTDVDQVLVSKKGGIVVIGAEGKNMDRISLVDANIAPRITVMAVKDDGARLTAERSDWAGYQNSTYHASVDNGYAVLPLPESSDGESYVVLQYSGSGSPSAAKLETVCLGRQTRVFKIRNGDVLYVGHYSVEVTTSSTARLSWRINYAKDFPSALSHVEKIFPSLSKQLRPAEEATRNPQFGNACGRLAT